LLKICAIALKKVEIKITISGKVEIIIKNIKIAAKKRNKKK
jgi:hypothetical protein